MRVIIVEDESTAVLKLEKLLKDADPSIEITGKPGSVKDTVTWLRDNPAPDLGFFDIQLSDDISFRIFDQSEINFPVVFVTAYDDYLLKAFEYNSVHYILKPVNAEKIRQALQKVKKLEKLFTNSGLRNILSENRPGQGYKSRLVVRKGIDYAPIDIQDIAYIFSQHKISFVRNKEKAIYILDQTLTDLELELDPALFFRANRQYIIHIDAIALFRSVENGKIKLELNPSPGEDVIVSKENAVAFRKWITK